MAEPIPEGTYLGEFRRGPAIFTVFQTALAPRAFRVDCSDGNGPSEVCTFSDRPGSGPKWHGAWNGDEWCAWIELEARKITEHSLPNTRARRPAEPLSRMAVTAPPRPPKSRSSPPPQDGTAAQQGRSIGGDRPARLSLSEECEKYSS